MKNSIQITLLLFSAVALLASCSNTRYLSENESLYVGSNVSVVDSVLEKSARKKISSQLESVIRPKQNRRFLGMRLKLTFYNLAGDPQKESGIRNWIRNQLGEPPVLGSDLNIEANNKILINYLQNLGYFYAESSGEKIVKKKKATAEFEVLTGPQYSIRNVKFPVEQGDNSPIAKYIDAKKESSLLKSGNPYNLEIIVKERERIDNHLKEIGYYYFSENYIIAQADTAVGSNLIDIELKLKWDDMPWNASQQYRINSVTIEPNYRLARTNNSNTRSRTTTSGDTTRYQHFQIVGRNIQYRPRIFTQAMQFKPGDLYNRREQNISLNRLVNLGTFKFVKNEFTPVRNITRFNPNDSTSNRISQNSVGENLLDVKYLLTPYPRKSWNIDLAGFTQNDSRAGSRGSISWRNKNTFKGAELLSVRLSGGFEIQYGGLSRRPNTYSSGIDVSLRLPHFLVPFFTIKPSGLYVPYTVLNTSYNFSKRGNLYQIHSSQFSFGYNWKEDAKKEHKLFPINITHVRTDTLDASASIDVNLSNLVYNGFIFGPTYEYVFNTQVGTNRKNNYYFSFMADLAGNVLGTAQGNSLDKKPNTIFGENYAQYLKFQTDFRYYRTFSENNSLATRLLLGYGYAYGNSYQLPNIKQFFSGGSSSLRGFVSRLVGPGTFNERYLFGTDRYIETLGDIKLEANVELRSKIYSFLHGGLFIDAGNIWLLRENTNFPGGKISSSFYKELAANAGAGLRLDFSVLMLRLDFAIPIRKPWFPEGQRWRFNDISFAVPEWRKENFMFILAIGYPF